MTATYNELRQLNKCSGSCSKYTVMPHCLTNINKVNSASSLSYS